MRTVPSVLSMSLGFPEGSLAMFTNASSDVP